MGFERTDADDQGTETYAGDGVLDQVLPSRA